MRYEEMMKISKDFFDTIDFKKWVKNGKKIRIQDLMDCIEEFYKSRPGLLPEAFDGYVFNFVDECEFARYLEQRYGWDINNIVVEYYYAIPN